MTWTTAMYRPRVKTLPGSFGDQEMVDRSNVDPVELPISQGPPPAKSLIAVQTDCSAWWNKQIHGCLWPVDFC
jgi:hypothetical protein